MILRVSATTYATGIYLRNNWYLPAGPESFTIRHILMTHQTGLPSQTGQAGHQGVGKAMISPGDHLEASVSTVMKCQRTERDLISTSHHGPIVGSNYQADLVFWCFVGNQRGEVLFVIQDSRSR